MLNIASWMIETTSRHATQNFMRHHPKFRKCLVSHGQLEFLLEALSGDKMEKNCEVALDLKSCRQTVGQGRSLLWQHPGQTKQYAFQDIGREEYVLKTDVVLVKAFEIGFVKEMFKPRRLITKQNAWLELRKSLQRCTMLYNI